MASEHILVVDDEIEILDVLKRYLTKLGYTVETADGWEPALENYDNNQYDLICLDVHMPGRDGFQIAKEIRSNNPDQKIIIITGLSPGQVFQYFKENEVDLNDVLYKPFNFRKVKSILRRVLSC